jgi:hypothetical protein
MDWNRENNGTVLRIGGNPYYVVLLPGYKGNPEVSSAVAR